MCLEPSLEYCSGRGRRHVVSTVTLQFPFRTPSFIYLYFWKNPFFFLECLEAKRDVESYQVFVGSISSQ